MNVGEKAKMLRARDEEILRAVWYYRYVTARDIAHQQLSKSSLNYTRELMANLSGNADFRPNNYLCRFDLPATSQKRPEQVFVHWGQGEAIFAGDGASRRLVFSPA